MHISIAFDNGRMAYKSGDIITGVVNLWIGASFPAQRLSLTVVGVEEADTVKAYKRDGDYHHFVEKELFLNSFALAEWDQAS